MNPVNGLQAYTVSRDVCFTSPSNSSTPPVLQWYPTATMSDYEGVIIDPNSIAIFDSLELNNIFLLNGLNLEIALPLSVHGRLVFGAGNEARGINAHQISET